MTNFSKHAEILEIQIKQLAEKEAELRFIAENVDRLIEAMYEKAEESRVDYSHRDAYDLWRGQSIDYSMRHTNNTNELYYKVQQEVA
jgi:hypothetical protein